MDLLALSDKLVSAAMSQETDQGKDGHITVSLNPEEIGYLQGLLREHVEYYERFVHRLPAKSTPRNRQRYQLVRGLWSKLQTASNTSELSKLDLDPLA